MITVSGSGMGLAVGLAAPAGATQAPATTAEMRIAAGLASRRAARNTGGTPTVWQTGCRREEVPASGLAGGSTPVLRARFRELRRAERRPCRRPSGLRLDERDVHHVLRDEPDLHLVGPEDLAHQQVVGAHVLGLLGL